jgi:RHS repeat-associated protein
VKNPWPESQTGSGGWGYHLGDALGSLRQLTGASGEITRTQSFEPFGAPLSSSGAATSEFGFAGEQDDITGLVFLRARYYDPGTGRFITKDPFPGYSSLPSTLHPYSYLLNNPVNLVDPSGQNPFLTLAAVSFIAGFGFDAWNQYQKNGGWCGFDPVSALRTGITAAMGVSLLTLSVLSGASLLGMGLQGFGVLFNSVTLFGGGLAVSGAATAASVWFLSGTRQFPRIYRTWGKNLNNPDTSGASPWGRSWTTIDPRTVSNYRNAAGLPNQNAGRFLSVGLLTDPSGVLFKSADPLHGNIGGLAEIVVPNPQDQIRLLNVLGINPPF